MIVLFGKQMLTYHKAFKQSTIKRIKKNFETKCLKEEDRGCLKSKVRILWKRKAL